MNEESCPHSRKLTPRTCSQCLGAIVVHCPSGVGTLPPHRESNVGYRHVGEVYRKPNTWRRR